MNKAKLKELLMNLDNQFCQSSLNEGELAWDAYLSEDAVMVTGGHREYLVGRKNIVKALKSLYEIEDMNFIWEPKIVDVSDDLTMGYTSGIYTRTYIFKDGYRKEIGKYTTIWKLINDEWKIVLDVGNEEEVDI